MEEHELAAVKSAFNGTKKFWSEAEVALAYKAWNYHFVPLGHPHKVDTKCGSCRRSVIIALMKCIKEGKL